MYWQVCALNLLFCSMLVLQYIVDNTRQWWPQWQYTKWRKNVHKHTRTHTHIQTHTRARTCIFSFDGFHQTIASDGFAHEHYLCIFVFGKTPNVFNKVVNQIMPSTEFIQTIPSDDFIQTIASNDFAHGYCCRTSMLRITRRVSAKNVIKSFHLTMSYLHIFITWTHYYDCVGRVCAWTLFLHLRFKKD